MKHEHKKTRKEKIIADYRHQAYTLGNKTFTPSPEIETIMVNKSPYSYAYVLPDVLKTGLLTFSIVAGEIILFFLLKNHIIILPMVKY